MNENNQESSWRLQLAVSHSITMWPPVAFFFSINEPITAVVAVDRGYRWPAKAEVFSSTLRFNGSVLAVKLEQESYI